MTFHFAHMAPPGATRSGLATHTGVVARWVRCPLSHRLVMHWDRPGDDPAIPAQHAPVPVVLPLTGPCAA